MRDLYFFCRHVQVKSDHKPLIPIHKKSLLNAPKRIQHMLLRTQKYDNEVVYKKGTDTELGSREEQHWKNKDGERRNLPD